MRRRFFLPEPGKTALDQRLQQKAVQKIALARGHRVQLSAGILPGADFALHMRDRSCAHFAIRYYRARTFCLNGCAQQGGPHFPLVGNIDHRAEPGGVERDDAEPPLVEINPFKFLIFIAVKHGEQQFLRRPAQLIDNLLIGQYAIGDIDHVILVAGILHEIAGATDIFGVHSLLLHRVDFLQQGAMGYRAKKYEFLAADALRGANLQIKQRAGEQRQQGNRAIAVEIVFCERNQCQFHEYRGPDRWMGRSFPSIDGDVQTCQPIFW